jgi:Fe-S cluster assembly ATPase SufC
MAEILRLQDGPTANFQLPCNIRGLKTAHLMEHTADKHLRDKSHRATEGRQLVNPLANQVDNLFLDQKLRL